MLKVFCASLSPTQNALELIVAAVIASTSPPSFFTLNLGLEFKAKRVFRFSVNFSAFNFSSD